MSRDGHVSKQHILPHRAFMLKMGLMNLLASFGKEEGELQNDEEVCAVEHVLYMCDIMLFL